MADFPKCKLCGARPVIFSSGRLFHPVTAKDCPIENSKTMEQDQWTALMGDQIQAIANKVCRDIPDRFTVCIVLEKDAGYVELWRGNHERFELDCDGGIEDQIENAMAVAMGEQQ